MCGMRRVALVSLLLSACSQREPVERKAAASVLGDTSDRSALGKERNDCRADKTCDPGLLCLSNLCVKPPAADCTKVGELLASFELGNYAEPEQRAPTVAKHEAACEKVYVTEKEGDCLAKVRDREAAVACVPRLFPDVPKPTTGECAQVAVAVRTQISRQMPSTDPRANATVNAMVAAVHASCEEDGWPKAAIDCYLNGSGIDVIQACESAMSPSLQQKLRDRVLQAVQASMQPR